MPEVELRLTLVRTRADTLNHWFGSIWEPNTNVRLCEIFADGTREMIEKRALDWCDRSGFLMRTRVLPEAPYREVTE